MKTKSNILKLMVVIATSFVFCDVVINAQLLHRIKFQGDACLNTMSQDSLLIDGNLKLFTSYHANTLKERRFYLKLQLKEVISERIVNYEYIGLIDFENQEYKTSEFDLTKLWLSQRLFLIFFDEFAYKHCMEKTYPKIIHLPIVMD